MHSVGDDESLALALKAEAVSVEPLLQFGPGASRPQLWQVRPDAVRQRGLARALRLSALSTRELRRLRGFLPLELIEPARDLAQPQVTLKLPQRALDLRPVLPALPRCPGLWMDPIHHEVDMRVGMVLVSDHQRLVLGQAQIPKDAIGHGLHLGGRDRIGWSAAGDQRAERHLRPRSLVARSP